MVQLYFGRSKVIGIDAEIGLEEALNVTLAFNQTAYGGILFVIVGNLLHGRTPVTIEGHVIVQVLQVVQADALLILILLQHIIVVLFTYIIIRDAQNKTVATGTDDGKHTVVEQ